MATAKILRLRIAAQQLRLLEEQEAARRAYLAAQRRATAVRAWLPRVAAFMTGFLACQGIHLWLLY